jgi:heme o synthase
MAPRFGIGWLLLVHPFPSIVVSMTGVALAVVAAPRLLGPLEVLRLFALFLSSQFAIGAFNDFCDADLDRLAKSHKPIPSGVVPRTAAGILAIALVAVTLILGASYGPLTLVFTALATLAGLVYDYPLKRTSWSWLPYVLGVPLLPLWAWSAIGALPPAAVWVYPIGALLSLALHLANALPDAAGDQAGGSRGLVQVAGAERSRWLIRAASFGAVALSAAVIGSRLEPRSGTVGLLGALIALVGVQRSSSTPPRGRGFELLAVGSGSLAIGVAIALNS